MALEKQINMYSVDTGYFYTNKEKYLHNLNCKYRTERNYIKNMIGFFDDILFEYGYSKNDISFLKKRNIKKMNIIHGTTDLLYEYLYWDNLIRYKRKKAYESKEKLLKLLADKINYNECSEKVNRNLHIRTLKEKDLHDTNIISVFESELSRTIGIQQDELTDSLFIVQVYYFDVFKDISYWGFMYKDEKYKYFTSSAGQIRKKKALFIKESVWNQIEKTIMCGLTIDKINSKGGINVNKHLAYMALSNSATDLWEEFDIDKTIIIDDFETDVYGTFDFVDETDYSITRKTDYVPIPHTDGCGMISPELSKKNFMIRAPWVKGLLGVFDYKRFIKENDYSPIINDIYGEGHNVITEDIQVILTKSQFKMYKYYDSWSEYKEYFKKYNCHAGICKVEEDRIKNSKINYQMLQTLTDITDDEIDLLAKSSIERITNICTSKDTMLSILGITPYNTHMTPFQKAVKMYPALLNDVYTKDIIRDVKDSLIKKYYSGKLEVNGKYTFLMPDLYAACEYWFGHIEQPNGLLEDKEVFCWLFRQNEKLDCLRSPHLYREHAVRCNIAGALNKERKDKIRRWFTTNALYTSTHDLISKLLQFDCDGDISLVVADSDFVRIAERNMEGVVPLYYNMKKAAPVKLNNKSIYSGLNAAFTSGSIGTYSNNISKIWNSDIFINGTYEEQQKAIYIIKVLCMENNFCIDSAKTLYMPERAPGFSNLIAQFTKCKLPAFFEFAKDKENEQVGRRNDSFVNKLYSKIPNKPINTRGLEFGKLEYKKMMSNTELKCSDEVAELYNILNKKYRYMINMKDEYIDNLRYIACELRTEFVKAGYSDEAASDMLVDYLYGGKKKRKQLLWFLYGQNIVDNLERNINIKKTKEIQCIDCGKWLEVPKESRSERCDTCQNVYKKAYQRDLMRKRRQNISC